MDIEMEGPSPTKSPGIASQDFRDGAATGIGQLARRLRIVAGFGITLTPDLIDEVADATRSNWGGQVFPQDEWL
jgi:hypothetical protein